MKSEKVLAGGIVLLLFFSVIASGSVDLWAQTIVHLGTILLLILYFFVSFQRKKIVFVSPPTGLFILLFSLIFSYLFSYSRFTSREEFFNWLNYLLFFLFALSFAEEKEILIKGIILTGVFLVFRGILDYLYQRIYPLKSSLLNSNILAGYLIMAIPLTIHQITDYKLQITNWKFSSGIWYLVSGIWLLVGLIFTGSLGAILSLLIALAWYFRKKRRIFLALILISISILAFKFSQLEVSNRLLWWQGALKMFLSRPFTGVGLGTFARYYPQFKTQGLNSLYAHNHYLQILAENGIFALLGFLGMIIHFFQPASPSGGQKVKDLGICIGIVAILIHNFIDYNLAVPGVALTFWTLCGLEMNRNKRIVVLDNLRYVFIVPFILLLIFSFFLVRFFLANRAYARGIYYFNTEKNLPKAERELLTSLKLDSKYTPTYQTLSAVYVQYYSQDKSENWLENALVSIGKAIKEEKNYAPYLIDKVWIHYLKGEKEIARKTLEQAKKLKIPIYLITDLENLLRGNYLK